MITLQHTGGDYLRLVALVREPHYEPARKIFELIYQEKIEAYSTASSVTDIYYITAKRLGDDAARSVIRNLLNLLVVISVDGDDCTEALDLPVPDYEDALISACAVKEDLDYVITNDTDFLQIDKSIAFAITPAGLLDKI